jgi:hypothetical protein
MVDEFHIDDDLLEVVEFDDDDRFENEHDDDADWEETQPYPKPLIEKWIERIAVAVVMLGIAGGLFWLGQRDPATAGALAGLIGLFAVLLWSGLMLGTPLGDGLRAENPPEAVMRPRPFASDLPWYIRLMVPVSAEAISSLATKGVRGRGRRAQFGAAFLGLIGTLLGVVIYFIAPNPKPNALSLTDMIVVLAGTFAVIGALAGYCSTGW